jgi:light-regulated signal transduction histidine kinase (bacteriophytochrome)
LKEPVRGINNYALFLREDHASQLDPEAQSKIQTIQRLTRHMEDLIESLLYYSRVGRAELSVQETDQNVILRDIIDSLHVSLQERGVEVRIPQTLPIIRCDRVRVGEVFRNLITNAMKYNDKAEKWIEIGFDQSVPGKEGQTETVFHVRDNGIGILDKHRQAVFRIFKRLHGRTEFGGGTGAGLTIVKKIIERHGGRIWIESTVGQGSTFFFTLPQG